MKIYSTLFLNKICREVTDLLMLCWVLMVLAIKLELSIRVLSLV